MASTATGVSKASTAVAVFNTRLVKGEVIFTQRKGGIAIEATFTQLEGFHGFHIHKAGDLRGEGCKGACDHYHVGPPEVHGGPPGGRGERHTGDLGNVSKGHYKYVLKGCSVTSSTEFKNPLTSFGGLKFFVLDIISENIKFKN